MCFALPESMREYISDLIQRDQEDPASKRLRERIAAGLASRLGRRRTPADAEDRPAIARGETD
jgi:hypothetical protein